MPLAEHQFTHLEHPVSDPGLGVIRTFQRQVKTAARRASATGPGHHAALQVQAVVGGQADAAAVTGYRHRALPRHCQLGLGAGGVQSCAVADHHKQVAGLGQAGVQVQRAAQADAAAVAHHAITAPLAVHRRGCPRCHIDQRVLANPDRAAMTGRIHRFRSGCSQPLKADAAAPGIERAIHCQLTDAAQVDGLPRIDVDHRPLAHGQGRARQLRRRGEYIAGGKAQTGAATLGQHAFGGIFLIQRRGPLLQGRGRCVAGRHRGCLRAQSIGRQADIHLSAVGDDQPFVAGDVVGREALVEEVAGQVQGVRLHRTGTVADLHRARLQGQGAAAIDAITAHVAIQGQSAEGAQGHVAAFAADQLAVYPQGGPGGHVHPAAGRQVQLARTAQRNLAAVDIRKAAAIAGFQQQVIPAPAGVEFDACAQRDLRATGQGGVLDHAGLERVDLAENVAGVKAAAVGREVGIDIDARPEQGDVAAVGHAQRAIDADLLASRDLDGAQRRGIEQVAVEHDLALAVGRQCIGKVQVIGNRLRVVFERHLIGVRPQGVAQGAVGFVVERRVLAHDQLRELGHGLLGLLVTVQVGHGRLSLAIALEHIADQAAFQHRAGGADHQFAGVPAHGVPGLIAALGGDQRVVVILGLAPAHASVFVTLVDTGIENVAGRFGQLVQTPIRPLEPGLADIAALHVHGAARQIDLRALLGHRFLAGKGHGAALGHPFTHRMALGAEVTADFQQATGGVPAVGGVAVGAGGHKHQVAKVDPHITVDQLAVVAVDRRIALLVTLHVDLDVVGFHRHLDADGPRYIDHRPVAHQAALAGTDGHLAAGGEGDRALAEIHSAAADDLDP